MESVVLTLARPRPVALATSLAVIAFPLASAASTALLVAPDAVRPLAPLPLALSELARLAEVVDADEVVERLGFGAAGALRRELGVNEPSLLPLAEPSAANARRSLSTFGEQVVQTMLKVAS